MDKRGTVIAISLSVGVICLWLWFVTWYTKHHPTPTNTEQATTQPASPTTAASATTGPSTQAAATTGPTTGPSVSAGPGAPAGLHAIEPQEGTGNGAVLGSADKNVYAMQVYLTQHGAGVEKVILNDFKREVHSSDLYTFQEAYADHPGTEPLGSQAIEINGTSIDLMGAPWMLIEHADSSATFRVLIAQGDTPIAEVTKTYTLSQRKADDKGYQVHVDQSVKALGDQGLRFREVINGPTSPPREIERGGDIAVLAGYAQPHQSVDIAMHAVDGGDFKAGKEPLNLTEDSDKHHVIWVGQVSTYFNALVLPEPANSPGHGFSVRAEALNPDSIEERDVRISFESDAIDLKPGAPAASLPMSVYFGPKSRDVLRTPYYEAWPRMYDRTLFIRGGWALCNACTWDWLINALFAVLYGFHWVFRDWGVAIICLVVIVRLLLHPLTKAGQVQMMKMQRYAPEIEKLKKKYGDDKEGLNKEMMKFYQEQGYGLGPMLGCLPMFLQMPIWIALWQALQSTFELRQAPFLYGLTWIKDLAKPDYLIHLNTPVVIPYVGWHVWGLNILPILMAVVTYFNQKYFMPTPLATTPEQEQQQKMTRAMSLIFPLMFYTLPSGLNLYYVTSMTLGIWESKRIRDHIREREEAEKAGRVIVDARPTRGARQRGDKTPEPKKGGLWAKIAQMQARVEQMRDEQEKKNRGRK